MDLRSVLVEIHTALRGASIGHALIGGLALAAHGAARATTDLDLLADGERADDVDRIVRARGYDCLHRSQDVANYASADRAKGRVDFLFARRPHGRAMLARAREHSILGERVRVVEAATAEELASLREDGLCEARRRDFQASARATAAWEREHAAGIEAILDWIDQLRGVFGDPPVDRTPWRGSDFRL
jgi:hypothetical protein